METPELIRTSDLHKTIPEMDLHEDIEDMQDMVEVIDERDGRHRTALIDELHRTLTHAMEIATRILVDEIIEVTKPYHSTTLTESLTEKHDDAARSRLIRFITPTNAHQRVSIETFTMWVKRAFAPFLTGVELLRFDISFTEYMKRKGFQTIPCYPKQIVEIENQVNKWRQVEEEPEQITERCTLTNQLYFFLHLLRVNDSN